MPGSEHRAWLPAHSGLWRLLEAEVNWTLVHRPVPGEMRPEDAPVSQEPRALPLLTGAKMPGHSFPLMVPYLFHEGWSLSSSHTKPLSFQSPVWSLRSQPEQHYRLRAAKSQLLLRGRGEGLGLAQVGAPRVWEAELPVVLPMPAHSQPSS